MFYWRTKDCADRAFARSFCRSGQAYAERDTGSQPGRRIGRGLSTCLLLPCGNHIQQGVCPRHQRDGRETRGICTLRTRDDNRIADFEVSDRDSRQAFKHVVDIETATAAGATSSWTTTAGRTIASAAALSCGSTAPAWTAWSTSHPSALIPRRKPSQHCIMLDDNR